MRSRSIAPLSFLLAHASIAQICMPDPHSLPNDGYSYLREEMKALRWIRGAMIESSKIKPPSAPDDLKGFHSLVELHTTAESVLDRYNCATVMLKPYKGSGNEYIKESAETLQMSIDTTKDINKKMIGMMDFLYSAKPTKEIDQVGIAKMLGNVKSLQKDVIGLSMAATKMSTFLIFKMEKLGRMRSRLPSCLRANSAPLSAPKLKSSQKTTASAVTLTTAPNSF